MGIKELQKNILEIEDLGKSLFKLNKNKEKQAEIRNQIKILNDSIPELLNELELIKSLPTQKVKDEKLVKIDYKKPDIEGEKDASVLVMKKDSRSFMSSMFKIKEYLKKVFTSEKKSSYYVRLSSKLFFDTSNSFVNKGYFKQLNLDLRKANIKFLLNTYVSLMLFSTLLAFAAGLLIFVFLLFFSFSLEAPFIQLASGSFWMNFLEKIWIILFLPALTFLMFYIYQGSEAKTIGKKIDQEMPFVVINMSAIASSEIEPSKIFQIIARSGEEYPYTKNEFEKVINYVNVYGYDVTTALRTCAEKTSSKNLKELFNGLANSISSGTSLTNFLDKRAESLLFNYKLEREQYTKLAETFMNIYISLVIAAPLVLMLTFFLMSLGGLGIGISLNMISVLIVLIVVLINIVFLVFLHLKQPTY